MMGSGSRPKAKLLKTLTTGKNNLNSKGKQCKCKCLLFSIGVEPIAIKVDSSKELLIMAKPEGDQKKSTTDFHYYNEFEDGSAYDNWDATYYGETQQKPQMKRKTRDSRTEQI